MQINKFIFLFALFLLFSNSTIAADFTVTRSDDRNNPTCAAGDCSLREAIGAANAAAGADRIFFDASLNNQTITLSNQLVTASNDTLTISGRGANLLTIDGGGLYRIFNISPESDVTITGLKLTGGNGSNGGGAAIRAGNSTVITLERVDITGNTSPGSNEGGGIYFEGAILRVRNSTISNNKAYSGAGLVHYGTGTMYIVNSTISNNTLVLGGYGGGIAVTGENFLRNVTINGNSFVNPKTVAGGGGITVFSGGKLNFANTVIAGNDAQIGKEIACFSQFMTSAGNNLVGDAAGDSTVFGTTFTYQPSDKLDTNPMLGGLTINNGGPTPTHALLAGSPAIDAGSNALAVDSSNGNAPLQFDQRFYQRIASGNLPGAIVDIGAYEFNAAPVRVSISGKVTFGSGTPAARAAISLTDASGNVKKALVNPFGYYKFENIPAGQTVILQATAKNATFSPQILDITGDVANANFTAQP